MKFCGIDLHSNNSVVVVTDEMDRVLDLLELIAQKRVGKRLGRIEPRAIKRRPKPYPMLMKTRRSARAEVRKNGHPKKVK